MEATTRALKRENTRTQLRRSASLLFATEGVAMASVDSISQTAGFSRGAFYANYRTKEDLMLDLLTESLDQEGSEWIRLTEQGNDVEAILQSFIQRFNQGLDESSRGMLWLELTLHAERHAAFGDRYRELIGAHNKHVARMFTVLFEKAGRQPPADPQALAASTMGFGCLLSLGSTHAPGSSGANYAAEMFLLYLRGLIAAAPLLPASQSKQP